MFEQIKKNQAKRNECFARPFSYSVPFAVAYGLDASYFTGFSWYWFTKFVGVSRGV